MDFNEWASKMNHQFQENIQPENETNLNTGREMISRKAVEFDCGYFVFRTKPKFLPKHYRLITQIKNKGEDISYDEMQSIVAEIMADLDIDGEHDKQFWISFDEETGELMGIFSVVTEELQSNVKSAQVFRKQ